MFNLSYKLTFSTRTGKNTVFPSHLIHCDESENSKWRQLISFYGWRKNKNDHLSRQTHWVTGTTETFYRVLSPWGRKESDRTERLNWPEHYSILEYKWLFKKKIFKLEDNCFTRLGWFLPGDCFIDEGETDSVFLLLSQLCLLFLLQGPLQAPLSTESPRQEYGSGLPFPSPGDLPDPGMEPMFPALQADSLPLSHQGSCSLFLGEIKCLKNFKK